MILQHKDHHIYKIGPVTSFGWLKRAQKNANSAFDVWESPEGSLIAVQRGYMPTIAVFTPPPGFKPESLVQ